GCIAGRSGGEEFTLLLEADEAQTDQVLARLRDRFEPIHAFGQTIFFSLSFGVCQSDASTGTLEDLLREADLALYRAKNEGRDRVIHALRGVPAST
ncbi:MAG: tetrapyrrole methylase, partial [Betaproteobacteria bacterium HGW-Betaproteobacteria-17]